MRVLLYEKYLDRLEPCENDDWDESWFILNSMPTGVGWIPNKEDTYRNVNSVLMCDGTCKDYFGSEKFTCVGGYEGHLND